MAYKSSTSVAAAGSLTQDINVHGGTYLAVTAQAGPTATAAADVSITVFPYDDNPGGGSGGTASAIAPIQVPLAAAQPANTLVSNIAYATAIYLIAGYTKVQIQVKNNNAGALPVAFSFDQKRA